MLQSGLKSCMGALCVPSAFASLSLCLCLRNMRTTRAPASLWLRRAPQRLAAKARCKGSLQRPSELGHIRPSWQRTCLASAQRTHFVRFNAHSRQPLRPLGKHMEAKCGRPPQAFQARALRRVKTESKQRHSFEHAPERPHCRAHRLSRHCSNRSIGRHRFKWLPRFSSAPFCLFSFAFYHF